MKKIKPRRVVLIAFEGVEALDITGPAGVFSRANDRVAGAYEIVFASPGGGQVTTQSGIKLADTIALSSVRGPVDSVLIAGGAEPALRKAIFEDWVSAWIERVAKSTRRVGSVCTGAFILGAAGLLDGRRVVTHWASCALLQHYFPKARVDHNAIYIVDGPICTSAGVTAGIDLALSLVEADLGRTVAAGIAKELVLFLHRPGGQAQFSTTLVAQTKTTNRFSELLTWMTDNPKSDLTISTLAERAAMSERTFARRFVADIGRTPSQFVAELRLDHAKLLLETTQWPLKKVAHECGFGSVDTLHRLFQRLLGVTPDDFRKRFGDLK